MHLISTATCFKKHMVLNYLFLKCGETCVLHDGYLFSERIRCKQMFAENKNQETAYKGVQLKEKNGKEFWTKVRCFP